MTSTLVCPLSSPKNSQNGGRSSPGVSPAITVGMAVARSGVAVSASVAGSPIPANLTPETHRAKELDRPLGLHTVLTQSSESPSPSPPFSQSLPPSSIHWLLFSCSSVSKPCYNVSLFFFLSPSLVWLWRSKTAIYSAVKPAGFDTHTGKKKEASRAAPAQCGLPHYLCPIWKTLRSIFHYCFI